MELALPSVTYKESYSHAVDERRTTERHKFWEDVGSPSNVEEYIQLRLDHTKGKNLPKGYVPSSTFWLIDEKEFCGEVNIRHELNANLRTVGGHIGYWIRPSKRKQGYGKAILRLALEEAKKLGIYKILITCDETNIGSRKIIEANGGVLGTSKDMGSENPVKLLFWIDVENDKK